MRTLKTGICSKTATCHSEEYNDEKSFMSVPAVGTRISPGACPERIVKIPRSARNDRVRRGRNDSGRRGRNDSGRRGRNDKASMCTDGFTLLELILVIFILSLALALSFPHFTFEKDGKLKSEAGRIASILRYLHESAVSTKEPYAINVNFKERVMRYKGPDGEKAEKIENLSGVTLQSRGNVSDGELTVFFGPAGAGESFSIHLTGAESSMTVFFNALSGRVKVIAQEKT